MPTRALALTVLLSLTVLGAARGEEAAPDVARRGERAVVVELFTSQGCSSCPPADRLLAELGAKGAGGVEVIPLSFHVDYWNHIGWTDPFSAAEWSLRQRRYAARFASDTVYTPQIVVDGRSESVGSRRGDVERLLAAAAKLQGGGEVRIRLEESEGPLLAIAARLETGAPAADLLVALFETDLVTKVGSGENARRTLRNDYVVRRLTPLARLEPGQETATENRPELHPAWRRDHLGVAVFLQSPATLEILGASSLRLY